MCVLYITYRYLPAIGGSEKHITNFSEGLGARGHQVGVFASRLPNYCALTGRLGRTTCRRM